MLANGDGSECAGNLVLHMTGIGCVEGECGAFEVGVGDVVDAQFVGDELVLEQDVVCGYRGHAVVRKDDHVSEVEHVALA